MAGSFASTLVAVLALTTMMVTSCFHRPVARVHTEYWLAKPGGRIAFPEQDPDGLVWKDLRTRDNIGICFSGGGARSATATIGQLRALRELGILHRTRYISSVSLGAMKRRTTSLRETRIS